MCFSLLTSWGRRIGLVLMIVAPLVTLASLRAVGQDDEPVDSGANPTIAEGQWLIINAKPLSGLVPDLETVDLEPLVAAIGSARVVALGQPNYGSRDFLELHHRLLQHLSERLGFTVLCVESNAPEARRVSELLAGARGALEPRLGELHWPLRTRTMQILAEWMRDHNKVLTRSDAAARLLTFEGFDITNPRSTARIVRDFVAQHYTLYGDEVEKGMQKLRQVFGRSAAEIPVVILRGKQLRLSASILPHLRTDRDSAGLWIQVERGNREPLYRDLGTRAPRGKSRSWVAHNVTMNIPTDATRVLLGMLVYGKGWANFDWVQITIDGEPYIDDAFDRGFEGETLTFFEQPAGNYRASINTAYELEGKQSMRLESTTRKGRTLSGSQQWQKIHNHLKGDARARLIEKGALAAEVDRVIHCARLTHVGLQWKQQKTAGFREQAMADNLLWIIEQNPETRVIISAHNTIIARTKIDGVESVGARLHKKLRADYFPIAMVSEDGKCAVRMNKATKVIDFDPPIDGCVERFLRAGGHARYYVILGQLVKDTKRSGWVHDFRPYRAIGTAPRLSQFGKTKLAEEFEIVFYLKTSAPARFLD